jgi:2,4-dichlorophenol 6-monooxygenase
MSDKVVRQILEGEAPVPTTTAHSEDADFDVPVLIIGGGPAGLTSALELSRRGIQGLLLERRDFTSHFPRAHLLNVRTMETFADVGVADQIYDEAPDETEWHKVTWYTSLDGPTELHGKKIGEVPAWGGGPDAADYASASPRRFANLPQLRLDTILWEHAARAWPDRVLAQQEVVDLTCDEDGAVVTVIDRTTSRRYRVRARYVIAADGGRTCADLLGVKMAGPRALVDNVNVFMSADLSDYAEPDGLITFFINPSGQGSFAGALLALGPGEWGSRSPQWNVGVSHLLDAGAEPDEATMIERAVGVLGISDLEYTVHAVSHWQFEGVVADRFRVGPVFIVGDAAHRHPPTGGLGLNTAIGDVSNLAWKLAAVLNGEAAESLLDTYEIERLPVAARNVEHSLRNAGRHRPIGAALGLQRGQTEDEGWAEIAIWAGDTPEGARRRADAARAVAENAEDFSQLNIEAGFAYEGGAVIPDGTPRPDGYETAQQFVPTARPGHHIPHVWLERDGAEVSTSDLIAPVGMTLVIDAAGGRAWADAAANAAHRVHVVAIGGDLTDPDGEWAAIRGTGKGGALLVRPDRHIAWRAADQPSDVEATLRSVLERVLNGPPQPPVETVHTVLERITEAGEAIRSTSTSAPAIFTVSE